MKVVQGKNISNTKITKQQYFEVHFIIFDKKIFKVHSFSLYSSY